MHHSYFRQLSKCLHSLSRSERIDIISYYQEYLAEMSDNPDPVSVLGTPEQLAAEILADYKDTPFNSKANWFKRLLIGTLVLLNPITLVFLPLILVLILCAGMIVFSVALPVGIIATVFGAIILAIPFGGFETITFVPAAFATSVPLGLMYLGIALVEFALLFLLCHGISRVIYRIINGHRSNVNFNK